MYYENKNNKAREIIIISIFMIIVISLLIVLIWKVEGNQVTTQTNYDVSRLYSISENNEKNDITKVIEKAVKNVVGISKLQQSGNSIFLGNFEKKLGLGSGIIITDNGYILTNQHVVGSKYSNCYVTLENGQVYDGTVVWADTNIDLAIVKISANNLQYMEVGDSDQILLAQDVYAIGNPIGIEFQRTVTKGIISGINRTIKIEDAEESNYMEDLIQTDATINEGNSGGALINERGELIGINTVKISDAEGIGFAVPINIIKPIIEKLIKTGKFEEAYLGIYGYDKEVIPYLDSTINIDSGVYIAKILKDGPLYNMGIIETDIITKIDDTEINKMNDLKKYIYSKNPEDTVRLTILRKNEKLTFDVKLGYKM